LGKLIVIKEKQLINAQCPMKVAFGKSAESNLAHKKNVNGAIESIDEE